MGFENPEHAVADPEQPQAGTFIHIGAVHLTANEYLIISDGYRPAIRGATACSEEHP
jgi:hypothetical protein